MHYNFIEDRISLNIIIYARVIILIMDTYVFYKILNRTCELHSNYIKIFLILTKHRYFKIMPTNISVFQEQNSKQEIVKNERQSCMQFLKNLLNSEERVELNEKRVSHYSKDLSTIFKKKRYLI